MRYIDFTQTRDGIDMTPFEEKGWGKDDFFEVVGVNGRNAYSSNTKIGMQVKLYQDDGSTMPFFKSEDGDCNVHCINLVHLKKITDSEGWIEWHGGYCPVECGTLVDVKYRDGKELLSLPALVTNGGQHLNDASEDYWLHDLYSSDIIAYRLSEPKKSNVDDLVLFNEYDNSEYINKVSDDGFIIVNLISSVAPNVSVSDALEIASTLQEHGFKK